MHVLELAIALLRETEALTLYVLPGSAPAKSSAFKAAGHSFVEFGQTVSASVPYVCRVQLAWADCWLYYNCLHALHVTGARVYKVPHAFVVGCNLWMMVPMTISSVCLKFPCLCCRCFESLSYEYTPANYKFSKRKAL